jgi:hypothetical protein
MDSRHTGRLVKKINSMKKIIALVKKFLFGTKVKKAAAVAEVVNEVKKVAPKKPITRRKKQ